MGLWFGEIDEDLGNGGRVEVRGHEVERVGLHAAGGRDATADFGEVGLLGIDFDEECGWARGIEGFEEGGAFFEAGTEFLQGDAVGLEELRPDGHAKASVGVAAYVTAAEVVFLHHADGGVTVVVVEEDLEVESIDGDGA